MTKAEFRALSIGQTIHSVIALTIGLVVHNIYYRIIAGNWVAFITVDNTGTEISEEFADYLELSPNPKPFLVDTKPVTPASILYRIYTEDTYEYRRNAIALVNSAFGGFTVLQAHGYWDGMHESSLVVEIVGSATDADTIRTLATDIKTANRQQAVLITQTPITNQLV